MAEDTGTPGAKGKAPRGKGGHAGDRRGRGFARAGTMIGPQLNSVAARRGYAEARLRALWAEIVGPDCAAIARPVKLASARGPVGGLLTLAVSGPHAPRLQMMIPVLRERINAALGPNAVGRVQLVHAAAGFAETPAPRPEAPAPTPDLHAVRSEISSIGDEDLRRALETLARNVLSRPRPFE